MTYLLQKSISGFMDFCCEEYFSKKYMKFGRGEKKSLLPKYLGILNKKKLPLLDKRLTWEFLDQTLLSFIGMRVCSLFGSNHKNGVWKTDRETPVAESILRN